MDLVVVEVVLVTDGFIVTVVARMLKDINGPLEVLDAPGGGKLEVVDTLVIEKYKQMMISEHIEVTYA